ncbi:hypothetical protein ES703_69120 [subsurface metagenome]
MGRGDADALRGIGDHQSEQGGAGLINGPGILTGVAQAHRRPVAHRGVFILQCLEAGRYHPGGVLTVQRLYRQQVLQQVGRVQLVPPVRPGRGGRPGLGSRVAILIPGNFAVSETEPAGPGGEHLARLERHRLTVELPARLLVIQIHLISDGRTVSWTAEAHGHRRR